MAILWSPEVELPGGVNVNNFPATQPVSGTVNVGNFPATQPVSGTVSVDNFPGGSTATATVTSVAVNPSSAVTLAASNASRIKTIIHNESGTLYVKLGSSASLSSYSYRLTANATLEVANYTGDITAIKNTGTSNALVTEL
jgi:hypothetical protein